MGKRSQKQLDSPTFSKVSVTNIKSVSRVVNRSFKIAFFFLLSIYHWQVPSLTEPCPFWTWVPETATVDSGGLFRLSGGMLEAGKGKIICRPASGTKQVTAGTRELQWMVQRICRSDPPRTGKEDPAGEAKKAFTFTSNSPRFPWSLRRAPNRGVTVQRKVSRNIC